MKYEYTFNVKDGFSSRKDIWEKVRQAKEKADMEPKIISKVCEFKRKDVSERLFPNVEIKDIYHFGYFLNYVSDELVLCDRSTYYQVGRLIDSGKGSDEQRRKLFLLEESYRQQVYVSWECFDVLYEDFDKIVINKEIRR